MKKVKETVAKNALELAEALGLEPAEGAEIEFRTVLNSKIIDVIDRLELTHAEVAKLAGTSRSRITAIVNRNTSNVSSDLMLRILACLGYQAKVSFRKAS